METILPERRGRVGVITMNRLERFNAMDVKMAQDFRRAALQLARDETIRAVVLQGAPGVFCSGADLKFIRDGGDAGDLAYLTDVSAGGTRPGSAAVGPGFSRARYGDVFKQILEYIHSAISEIRRAPKPFVAAVDGVAAAGGLGIAMACDLVVASERASFEWAYSRTALTGAESATFMLPRLIGLRRSLELLFVNPRLTAAQAREYGLVTAVHPTARFDDEVGSLAARLAQGPARAFAISKELMNQAAGMDRLDEHLDRELDALARAANGSEFDEGLRAFFDKRAPCFAAAGPAAGAEPVAERPAPDANPRRGSGLRA
jgi:2-(1,2-epoxy-1,2-dihydrophenyl)acetyl-CoA isomerase